MIKKLSMLILGALVVAFCAATIPAGKVDAAPAKKYGQVNFDIAHYCNYDNGPRPWVLGEARHWNPGGQLKKKAFRHRSGNEKANLGKQLVGPSQGDARVTLGWKTCKNCQTGRQYYSVTENMSPVSMVMGPK